MTQAEIIKLFESHSLRIWFEENKNRWCVYGQGGIISRCLRATRATHIIMEDGYYLLEEITHEIYILGDIKLAFKELKTGEETIL